MNHTLKAVKKCLGCRCLRLEDEFIYGNKINKSCLKCRDKRKRNREPKTEQVINEEPKDNDLIRYIRHQKIFKKINNEFLQQKAKQVHRNNMKYIFVDIRDCRIYSDKDFSYTN